MDSVPVQSRRRGSGPSSRVGLGLCWSDVAGLPNYRFVRTLEGNLGAHHVTRGRGVSWSFLLLGGLAAVLADSTPGQRGKATGLYNGVSRLGSFAAVLVGGLLADRLGFAAAALLFAGITALGAVLSSLPSLWQGGGGRRPGRP